MINECMPEYTEQYDELINNLSTYRMKNLESGDTPNVATHYYNPDDERALVGVKQDDHANKIYEETNAEEQKFETSEKSDLFSMKVEDIKHEGDPNPIIERIYDTHIAMGMKALQWKYKEQALKKVLKLTNEKLEDDFNYNDVIRANAAVINDSCQDKVLKVFNTSLQVFNYMISSTTIETKGINEFTGYLDEFGVIEKLLAKSEEGNQRVTAKVHESLLDFSFHPKIGESIVGKQILERVTTLYQDAIEDSKPKTMLVEDEETNMKRPPLPPS